MGAAKRRAHAALLVRPHAVGVEAPNGRLQVRWDSESAATPFGQMAFFLEFLHLTRLYERWQRACPFTYTGPHGLRREDILGTWVLSLLAGHRRYAHMNAIRFDGVMPELLGMHRVVAEDTVRRFLKAIDETAGRDWLQSHLDACIQPLLSAPWILDVEVTVKPLYGHQEGGVMGHNPHKPGRPSHTYHTYQMAGLRLVLGVTVEAGNHSHSNTTLPGLLRLIDRFPIAQRPYCVRGHDRLGRADDSLSVKAARDQKRQALRRAGLLAPRTRGRTRVKRLAEGTTRDRLTSAAQGRGGVERQLLATRAGLPRRG